MKDTSLDVLFEDLSQNERKQTPNQIWLQEINLYQNMPRMEGKGDPLMWWKFNQVQLSFLSMHFIIFLFIYRLDLIVFRLSWSKILGNSCFSSFLWKIIFNFKKWHHRNANMYQTRTGLLPVDAKKEKRRILTFFT